MGGVDANDQLHGYYKVQLKCKKQYKYIFWFLFNLAILNVYILWKSNLANQQMKLKEFLVTLAKKLIGTYCSWKRIGRPSVSAPSPVRLCDGHFPTKATRQRCFYCHQLNHERHTTTWYCRTCRLHLCHTGEERSDFWTHHR